MSWKNSFSLVSSDLLKSSKVKTTIAVFISIYGLSFVYKSYKRYKRNLKRKPYPKDVVILYQIPRGFRAPSVSPFALKLETWLRMAKIPYKNEFGLEFSSKGLFPFITLNGVDVADSQFCIDYLSKKYEINFDRNLNDEQKAIARAILKLLEESLRWVLILHRYVYEQDSRETGYSPVLYKLAEKQKRTQTLAQGYGRHTREEVYSIGNADLKAINDIIGNKKFLFGDEATNIDAAVFGMVTQFLYHDIGPLNEYLRINCPNILTYIDNMKKAYWPDWNENISTKSITTLDFLWAVVKERHTVDEVCAIGKADLKAGIFGNKNVLKGDHQLLMNIIRYIDNMKKRF